MHPRADRPVAHRQHPGSDAERRASAPRARSVSRAPPSSARARSMPDRQVAVAEVEPHLDAELAQPVHHVEGVAGQSPAALVDPVGEPERDQVGVGRDVGAVDLDVVAGVGDHDELARDRRRRASRGRAWRRRCPRRARRPGRSQAGDLDSGPDLVADVDRDEQRRELLDDPGHLERPAVDRRAGPAISPTSSITLALSSRRSPQTSTSSSSSWSRSVSSAALTVWKAETTRTPSGAISCACWAAEPCHTPSVRVALPLTAAASGTVASTSSWPSRSAPLRFVSVSDWLRNGTLEHDELGLGDRLGVLRPVNEPSGTCLGGLAGGLVRRARRRASRSRSGRRPGRAAARARTRARRCRRRCRRAMARRGSLCDRPSVVACGRAWGPNLEVGMTRPHEFDVEGRLLTDVGGTLGFSVLSTPGDDRDDGADRRDARLPASWPTARRPSASRCASSTSARPPRGRAAPPAPGSRRSSTGASSGSRSR